MFIKMLGILDAFASIILFFLLLNLHIWPIIIIFICLMLILKGIAFFSWASLIDLIVVLTLILSIIISIPTMILFIVFLAIFQKAIFSFL